VETKAVNQVSCCSFYARSHKILRARADVTSLCVWESVCFRILFRCYCRLIKYISQISTCNFFDTVLHNLSPEGDICPEKAGYRHRDPLYLNVRRQQKQKKRVGQLFLALISMAGCCALSPEMWQLALGFDCELDKTSSKEFAVLKSIDTVSK
jgi:hypothetical protein